MHEVLHKMWMKHVLIHIFVQIFMNFYGGHMVQLYTDSFLYVFLIHLKWQSSSFSLRQNS